MASAEKDKIREHRIDMEIIVDAYGEIERAMGWYYYLEDNMCFPFKARCIAERATSPLEEGETVRVETMASEDECMHEMFVEVRWHGRKLAVPLSQLEAIEVDDETKEAIEDWQYWLARGYEF